MISSKVQILTILVSSQFCSPSILSITQLTENRIEFEKNISHLKKTFNITMPSMTYTKNEVDHHRAIINNVEAGSSMTRALQGYGCWCRFDEQHGKIVLWNRVEFWKETIFKTIL